MKKKFYFILILSILILLYIYINAYSYVSAVSSNLSNSVFRLHVIANSDSVEDQNLKYLVRDNILAYMESITEDCTNKQEIIEIMKNHNEDLKKVAEQTINDEGFSYPVNIEIGNFEFPTKTYGDISFPAGFYDALKIEIGTASGQNWWCVMFPPLCFINPTTGIVPNESKEILQEELPTEEYQIISDTDNSTISLKFKIIEFFEKSGLITAKNN